MRIRLRFTSYPPGLTIGDTPRPGCADCRGEGGWEEHYMDADGEYGGSNGVPCHCWNPARVWQLIRLPRWLWRRRRGSGGWSDEAPF